jgi:hypothetical protein
MEEDADEALLQAVHLLFLLGRVDYHPQTDSLEFIEGETQS